MKKNKCKYSKKRENSKERNKMDVWFHDLIKSIKPYIDKRDFRNVALRIHIIYHENLGNQETSRKMEKYIVCLINKISSFEAIHIAKDGADIPFDIKVISEKYGIDVFNYKGNIRNENLFFVDRTKGGLYDPTQTPRFKVFDSSWNGKTIDEMFLEKADTLLEYKMLINIYSAKQRIGCWFYVSMAEIINYYGIDSIKDFKELFVKGSKQMWMKTQVAHKVAKYLGRVYNYRCSDEIADLINSVPELTEEEEVNNFLERAEQLGLPKRKQIKLPF